MLIYLYSLSASQVKQIMLQGNNRPCPWLGDHVLSLTGSLLN